MQLQDDDDYVGNDDYMGNNDYMGDDKSEYAFTDEAFSDSVSEQEDRQAGFYFSLSDN